MNCPTPHKEVYANKGVALKAVKNIRKRCKAPHSNRRFIPVEPYPCRCGEYHLCTIDKAKFRRR